jgi:hypothetical protein
MADNELILLRSASFEQIFIMSLTDKNPNIWREPDQLRVQSKIRGPILDQYVWNLYDLANSTSTKFVDNFGIIPADDENWHVIFAESFKDDVGSKYISTVDTFNPVSTFAHPTSSSLGSDTRLEFYPIITSNPEVTTTNASNRTIYNCCVYPAYPVVFTSTIASNTHYGPVFAREISISINEKQPVRLDLTFTGGKSLKPDKKEKTSLTIDNYYRTLSFYDFAYAYQVFDTEENFLNFYKNSTAKSRSTAERIIDVRLSINNTYVRTATARNLSKTSFNTIEQGPKFIQLNERTVSGSITYITDSPDFVVPNSTALTFHFGDIFYFPMEKVYWQKHTVDVTAAKNYTHTFNFIAVAVELAVSNGFKSSTKNMYVSEFKVPTPGA